MLNRSTADAAIFKILYENEDKNKKIYDAENINLFNKIVGRPGKSRETIP